MIRKRFKELVSFMLVIAIIVMQFTVVFADNVEKVDYLAMQSNKVSLVKGTYVNGSILKGGIGDYSSAIFYLLETNDYVTDVSNISDLSNIDKSVFYENEICINSKIKMANIIMAAKKSQ